MANFYISDLHIGHANVIKFDNRPFKDLSEMHEVIVTNWNRVVTGNDTVYILGDFIWAKENDWPFYLEALAGNKVLIRGNHDPKEYSKVTRHYFQDIKEYKEVTDGDKRVILSHYPMPFHHYGFAEKCWMLYGHVHVTKENDYLQKLRAELNAAWKQEGDPRGHFINVGCMMPWMAYTPRTLEEIIQADKEWRGVQDNEEDTNAVCPEL